jgi:quinol monooxygenase YgiN
MHIVHVLVRVKPESVETFRWATIENARSSLHEPGVVRFDVAQRGDDPTQFVLVEVYRTPDDPPRHRLTAHYAAWRDVVEPLLAEPRSKVEYVNVYPEDSTWE